MYHNAAAARTGQDSSWDIYTARAPMEESCNGIHLEDEFTLRGTSVKCGHCFHFDTASLTLTWWGGVCVLPSLYHGALRVHPEIRTPGGQIVQHISSSYPLSGLSRSESSCDGFEQVGVLFDECLTFFMRASLRLSMRWNVVLSRTGCRETCQTSRNENKRANQVG